MKKQTILCLDMEGVLVPEIWINVAEKTGIESLKLTTKDIADYDELMQHRLKVLEENNIKLSDIQNVISTMDPYSGCVDFLDWAREKMQVIILSDTFIEFAKPLIEKMKFPTVFCHNLTIENDNIVNYNLRIKDQKTQAIKTFKGLNYNTIASGDSFNDTGMMLEADNACFFKPSPKTVSQFPQFKITENYEQLKNFIEEKLN